MHTVPSSQARSRPSSPALRALVPRRCSSPPPALRSTGGSATVANGPFPRRSAPPTSSLRDRASIGRTSFPPSTLTHTPPSPASRSAPPEQLGPPRHPPSSTGASAAVGTATFRLRRSAPRRRSAELLPPSPASRSAPPEKLRLGPPPALRRRPPLHRRSAIVVPAPFRPADRLRRRSAELLPPSPASRSASAGEAPTAQPPPAPPAPQPPWGRRASPSADRLRAERSAELLPPRLRAGVPRRRSCGSAACPPPTTQPAEPPLHRRSSDRGVRTFPPRRSAPRRSAGLLRPLLRAEVPTPEKLDDPATTRAPPAPQPPWDGQLPPPQIGSAQGAPPNCSPLACERECPAGEAAARRPGPPPTTQPAEPPLHRRSSDRGVPYLSAPQTCSASSAELLPPSSCEPECQRRRSSSRPATTRAPPVPRPSWGRRASTSADRLRASAPPNCSPLGCERECPPEKLRLGGWPPSHHPAGRASATPAVKRSWRPYHSAPQIAPLTLRKLLPPAQRQLVLCTGDNYSCAT